MSLVPCRRLPPILALFFFGLAGCAAPPAPAPLPAAAAVEAATLPEAPRTPQPAARRGIISLWREQRRARASAAHPEVEPVAADGEPPALNVEKMRGPPLLDLTPAPPLDGESDDE